MSKQPPPAPTASAVGPCPTIIQTVGRPALEVYPGPSHHPTAPLIIASPTRTKSKISRKHANLLRLRLAVSKWKYYLRTVFVTYITNNTAVAPVFGAK